MPHVATSAIPLFCFSTLSSHAEAPSVQLLRIHPRRAVGDKPGRSKEGNTSRNKSKGQGAQLLLLSRSTPFGQQKRVQFHPRSLICFLYAPRNRGYTTKITIRETGCCVDNNLRKQQPAGCVCFICNSLPRAKKQRRKIKCDPLTFI